MKVSFVWFFFIFIFELYVHRQQAKSRRKIRRIYSEFHIMCEKKCTSSKVLNFSKRCKSNTLRWYKKIILKCRFYSMLVWKISLVLGYLCLGLACGLKELKLLYFETGYTI